jgi:hypothetical protein
VEEWSGLCPLLQRSGVVSVIPSLSLHVGLGGLLKIFIRAKNGIHVFWTISTSAAGFILASCNKKVTHVTQRFFWRQREDTPVVYIRDNTRVHPSSKYVNIKFLVLTSQFL